MTQNPKRAALPRTLAAALLLSLAAAPLSAQSIRIDETRPLSPSGSVRIEVVEHTIEVEVWERNEVQVTGSYDAEFEEMDINVESGSFRFEIDRNNRGRSTGGGTLTVRLPAGIEVEAESVTGGVRVAGNFRAVDLESVSGSVDYQGNTSEVRLNSVSGSVRFVGTAERASLEVVSGSVRLEGSAQELDVESVSGSVTIAASNPVREIGIETVSGSVDFRGALAPNGELSVESFSGRVILTLDPNVAARFDLETLTAGIEVELPGVSTTVVRSQRFGPSRSATFTTGDGGGSVDVTTMSGRIVIQTP
jgi:DUF4097 and DUF4098 domain-containing protein YvlB